MSGHAFLTGQVRTVDVHIVFMLFTERNCDPLRLLDGALSSHEHSKDFEYHTAHRLTDLPVNLIVAVKMIFKAATLYAGSKNRH